MAYNLTVAEQIRRELHGLPGLKEKQMFGGVAFMLHGNMACGVIGDEMIVRVGSEGYAEALGIEGARPFDMTGRPMTGWVAISGAGLDNENNFRDWVRRGVDFAQSLPPK